MRAGLLHEQQGDFARAAAHYEGVIAACGTPPDDPGLLAAALCNMGGLLVGQGELSRALPLLERARSLLKDEVETPGLSYVEFHLGLARIAQGDVEGGLAALSTAQRIQQACGDIRHLSATLSAHAVVDIRRGRFDSAEAMLQQALDIQERLEEPEARVHTLRLLEYCMAAQGRSETAQRYCTEAAQLSMLLSFARPTAASVNPADGARIWFQ
ncbi:MAG: tetratricopeptide repeat protein [Hydrogenophaga sp.]|uniref:tetratricopeptide repeat protein n=1 Tax=Hydrogenophaga sp. TaxID=1904254 RepID=UPI0016AEE8BF|nr:tetratricopeptide repeat protein [Hydrogenophaga sp.]NIM40779.1 tetratricopeptide repeat protein [Hydrogenophaga sp.]NIN26254.1 tetratricopeptide repeat protein [Hydrogenophaga sp.]NIN31119.1 tetratricopeptide repeat protein [Hydrogenophaga sp.]NIN55162.1 tetratricopeptide repeat protein [Hydrogenophaga sp.]NIO51205.1 tetratricopeptide repeat protein [Hydrogenophaga sp.]